MPDGKAGSWAAIDGQEFTNSSRTIAYINNYGLPIQVSEGCWCPSITGLLSDCGPLDTNHPPLEGTGYYLPPSDPAPWYDEAVPESGAFLGFLMTEFEGLGSTFTRSTFDTIAGGAILGRLRPQARTLTWRGYLFGANCCAAEYGLRWLTAQLSSAGGCDGCDGSELDILLCCPDLVECDDCESSQGNGPISDAFRTFYRAGLIDGPRVLSRREIGCGEPTCSATPTPVGGVAQGCGNCMGCLIEIEFSLVAGNPYMHRGTQLVCEKSWPDCDTVCDPNNGFWVPIPTSAYPATEADGQKCLDSLDCSIISGAVNCLDDPNPPVPGCEANPLPSIPPFSDPCGCEPLFSTRICCEISNDIYGQYFEGVPTIEIFSGVANPLRNVIVSFWENPQERTCDDTDMFKSDCFKCGSVTIRFIPKATTLTIDGLTRTINAKCVGMDAVPAESLTISPFNWPILKCQNYIVTVDADCAFPVEYDATVKVYVTPREM